MRALHLRFNILFCLLAGLALMVSSCNLPLVSGEAPLTYKVGASGNEIKHPDGVKVVVPLGTLKGDAELSVGVSAENPPALEGSTPLGKVYEISLSKGAELLFPLEVYLPLERKPGARDAQYSAMRWEGDHWTRLQGQVEGEMYHFATEHTTLYRLFYWEASEYPVEFFNESMTKVHIRPWQYQTFIKYGAIGGTLIDGRYPDGTSRGWAYLPPGEYTQWCVDWSEFTKPVWDIFGGGYWTEFIGNFHFFFNQRVLLNRYSEIEMGKPNTARVRFTIGAAQPGLCGQSPSLGNTDSKSPLREQPMPWTTLEPIRTGTTQRTGTPARTSTAARTPTVQRTGTGTPDATTRTVTQSFPAATSSLPAGTNLYKGEAIKFKDKPDLIVYPNTSFQAPPSGVSVIPNCGYKCWSLNGLISLLETGNTLIVSNSNPSTAFGVQWWGSTNDGIARVSIDGREIWQGSTRGLGPEYDKAYIVYLQAAGLPNAAHTILIENMGQGPVAIALIGFGPASP